MASYGVTDKGFMVKRLDTILEEVHAELTKGFGVDTRLAGTSFLNTLITTFCGQVAELWEVAQDSYYAKFPSTATGVNLDNVAQYAGIRRAPDKETCYPLHCTGDDGTTIREGVLVATDTKPEIRLRAAEQFQITSSAFNVVEIAVTSVQKDAEYFIKIGESGYSYHNSDGDASTILCGLLLALEASTEYSAKLGDDVLVIEDTVKSRKNSLTLSDNLTTRSVTTVANFYTENYGKITIPNGHVTKLVSNISGFKAVTNQINPIYGRLQETDVELRQSYLAKSGLRSNTMMDSIISELLNNVPNVGSVYGYENNTGETDENGLPGHSIELIVEGGADEDIASAILRRKAGGIQTCGGITVNVSGIYGESIPISFSRPDYIYTWLKVVLQGDASRIPTNYAALTIASLMSDSSEFRIGTSMLTQLLNKGIYDRVAGLTYVTISFAHSRSSSYSPTAQDYKQGNLIISPRHKILLSESRIEVRFVANH